MADGETWSLPTLKTLLEERQHDSMAMIRQRFENLEHRLESEIQTFDGRFEAANRYKETYQERLNQFASQTLTREEANTRFSLFQEKVDTLSRVNWPLYSSFGGIAISMIVGLWVIVGLKIDATNQPVVVGMEQTKIADMARDRTITELRAEMIRQKEAEASDSSQKNRDISNLMQSASASTNDRGQLNTRVRETEARVIASQQADENSRTDRAQLNQRLHNMEEAVAAGTADRKSNEASFRSSLVEVETQFCGSDTVRNLMHANDLRVLSILWQHAGDLGVYPTDNAFYPVVCNRSISTSTK